MATTQIIAPVTKRWKWMLCGVLFLATILNYMDRQCLSLCKPMIMDEFKINNEQFGQLISYFRGVYAVMHIPAGFLADRFSLRLLFPLAVGIWSLAGALAFWVTGFGVFKLTRSLLGLGESVNWPFSTRIVSNMLPREDRVLGMGIFNSGAAMGALLSPLIIAPIAKVYGWRWAFLIVGGLGIVWIIIWTLFTGRGRAAAFANDSASQPKSGNLKDICAPFTQILKHPGFWLLILVSITINPCWYFLCDWIPGFLMTNGGLSFVNAAMFSIPIYLSADIGNFFGGGLVKYISHNGVSVGRARGITVLIGAGMASCIVFVPQVHHPAAVIALLAFAAVGINTIVPNQTACQPDVSFKNAAQIAGLTGLAANLFAAYVQPHIGKYVDRTGHYDLIFYMVAIFPWIAAATIWVFDVLITRRNKI